jgi:hypothetical protein
MSYQRGCAAVVLCLVAATNAFAQALPPVGPVVPKPAPTVEDYETVFAALLKANSDDRLWNSADGPRRAELLDRIQELSQDITVQMKPISPVVPRPPNPPPPPPPTDPNPKPKNPQPSKQEWDAALQHLHEVLQQGKGDLSLPAKTAQEMQLLIEQLAKGKPQ